MKLDSWILLTMSIWWVGFQRSLGCHNIETDQTEQNKPTSEDEVDDYFADVKVVRRKRNAVHQDVGIVQYFPLCIQAQLAVTEYSSRQWAGPVSYAVYHSNWYEEADDKICIGQNHTIECWIERLTFYLSGVSPALLAAQRCVKEYTDSTSGRTNPTPRYPLGLFFDEAGTCPVVDEKEYEDEFRGSINGTASDFESDSSISDFDDVIRFAKDDMICPSCDCTDLDDDDDEQSYDFEDGTNCGNCWTTRIAIAVRPKSPLRRSVRKATKKKAGLRKRPKPPGRTRNRNNPGSQNQNGVGGPTQRPAGQSGARSAGTTQGTVTDRPRAVFVAPVGDSSTSSGNTPRQTNSQRSRAVFVAPVSTTNSGSRTDTSRRGTNQPQQTEFSPSEQRDSRTVQAVQRQQQQRSSGDSPRESSETPTENRDRRREQSGSSPRQQQSYAQYVQPIRRPNSPSGQTSSSGQNRQRLQQQQQRTNQRGGTENEESIAEGAPRQNSNKMPPRQQQNPDRSDINKQRQSDNNGRPGKPEIAGTNRQNEQPLLPRSTTDSSDSRRPPTPQQTFNSPVGENVPSVQPDMQQRIPPPKDPPPPKGPPAQGGKPPPGGSGSRAKLPPPSGSSPSGGSPGPSDSKPSPRPPPSGGSPGRPSSSGGQKPPPSG